MLWQSVIADLLPFRDRLASIVEILGDVGGLGRRVVRHASEWVSGLLTHSLPRLAGIGACLRQFF